MQVRTTRSAELLRRATLLRQQQQEEERKARILQGQRHLALSQQQQQQQQQLRESEVGTSRTRGGGRSAATPEFDVYYLNHPESYASRYATPPYKTRNRRLLHSPHRNESDDKDADDVDDDDRKRGSSVGRKLCPMWSKPSSSFVLEYPTHLEDSSSSGSGGDEDDARDHEGAKQTPRRRMNRSGLSRSSTKTPQGLRLSRTQGTAPGAAAVTFAPGSVWRPRDEAAIHTPSPLRRPVARTSPSSPPYNPRSTVALGRRGVGGGAAGASSATAAAGAGGGGHNSRREGSRWAARAAARTAAETPQGAPRPRHTDCSSDAASLRDWALQVSRVHYPLLEALECGSERERRIITSRYLDLLQHYT